MWRLAIDAQEASGRAGRATLDRQVAGLAAQVARQPRCQHVATSIDRVQEHRGSAQCDGYGRPRRRWG